MKFLRGSLGIFLILLIVFAAFTVPIFAQGEDGSPTPEVFVSEIVSEITPEVVVAEPPIEAPSDMGFITDILTLIGEAVNSYPGGFLSAAVFFAFLQRFSNNPKIIDVLERQFDNATRSYPPEIGELLRGRMQGFGGALVDVGEAVREIGDGIPYNSKTPQG